MQTRKLVGASLLITLLAVPAWAATYYELAERNAMNSAQKQYSAPRQATAGISIQPNGTSAAPAFGYPVMVPAYAGPAPYYPPPTGSALPMLPVGGNGLPNPRQVRWAYGQVNAASDPFNAWGLSAPGMYVPWSTPTSSWTNAQGWDWWRNRAGDEGPAPPLW